MLKSRRVIHTYGRKKRPITAPYSTSNDVAYVISTANAFASLFDNENTNNLSIDVTLPVAKSADTNNYRTTKRPSHELQTQQNTIDAVLPNTELIINNSDKSRCKRSNFTRKQSVITEYHTRARKRDDMQDIQTDNKEMYMNTLAEQLSNSLNIITVTTTDVPLDQAIVPSINSIDSTTTPIATVDITTSLLPSEPTHCLLIPQTTSSISVELHCSQETLVSSSIQANNDSSNAQCNDNNSINNVVAVKSVLSNEEDAVTAPITQASITETRVVDDGSKIHQVPTMQKVRRTYGRRNKAPSICTAEVNEPVTTALESSPPLSLQPHRVITTYGGKRSFQFSRNVFDILESAPKQNQWICFDEDSESSTFKSDHELRELGLQRRFADELDDLIISMINHKPLALRRSSAMILCHKLQDVKFANVFRQHDFLVKFYDLLTVEEDDTLLQTCFLFILGVVVTDRRVGVWLVPRGLTKHLEHLLCKSDVIWTAEAVSTGSRRSDNDRMASQIAQLLDLISRTSHLAWITQPSHHILSVHLIAILMNISSSHGTKWIDMLFNKNIFLSLLSLLCDKLYQLQHSDLHKTMNETVALQCLRVIEDVIASCVFYKSLILENQDQLLKLVQALPWLIESTTRHSLDNTTSISQELPLCILRLCISITDNCTETAKALASIHLSSILMQVIYQKMQWYLDNGSVHNTDELEAGNDLVLLSLGLLVNLIEQSIECCQQLCTMRISTTCQQKAICWQQCNCHGDQVYSIVYLTRLFQYLCTKSSSSSDNLEIEIEKGSENAIEVKMQLTYLDVILGYLINGDKRQKEILNEVFGTTQINKFTGH